MTALGGTSTSSAAVTVGEAVTAVAKPPRPEIVRDCQHDGRHPHGDRTRYVADRCRCNPCRAAAAAYERHRIRQSAYGRWHPYVDAEPVRQHVRALMASGIGYKRAADLAGVARGVVKKLLYGDQTRQQAPAKRVRRQNADRLLAVPADPAIAAYVPARPTWRRIEGMVALGYTKAWIAGEIGQANGALQLQTDVVLARTERAVAALADRVGDTPGPSAQARAYALARGWLVPAYGTDEEIADQARITVELAAEARNEIAARRQRVHELLAQGVQPAVIAARLHITPDVVQADRRRAVKHHPTPPGTDRDVA